MLNKIQKQNNSNEEYDLQFCTFEVSLNNGDALNERESESESESESERKRTRMELAQWSLV
jgi:hypothetical protein